MANSTQNRDQEWDSLVHVAVDYGDAPDFAAAALYQVHEGVLTILRDVVGTAAQVDERILQWKHDYSENT